MSEKILYLALVIPHDLIGGAVACGYSEDDIAAFVGFMALEYGLEVIGQLVRQDTLLADGEQMELVRIVALEFSLIPDIDVAIAEDESEKVLSEIFTSWDIVES
jgi:hypothetical protein